MNWILKWTVSRCERARQAGCHHIGVFFFFPQEGELLHSVQPLAAELTDQDQNTESENTNNSESSKSFRLELGAPGRVVCWFHTGPCELPTWVQLCGWSQLDPDKTILDSFITHVPEQNRCKVVHIKHMKSLMGASVGQMRSSLQALSLTFVI